ncbi:MAG: Glycosyl transferase family 2 [Microgenomates group bacterium GW2011_GWA2_40_6]|nr:MAG: Glycosyl transferase family 2 [Microgenomates group bacterium GW2011_GWA2_40_6]
MSNISLLLITKNESENLKRWKDWLPKLKKVDELVVVDDNSTDDTKKIVNNFQSEKLKINLFNRGMEGDFSAQRNFAISKAKNDWVLFVDADEEPSDKLIKFLNIEELNPNICFAFKRNLIYIDQVVTHGQAQNDYPIRFFTKDSGKYINSIHEIWETDNCVVKINKPLYHYSAPNLKIFISKLNLYSTLRAQELFQKHASVNLFQIVFYPLAKFLQTYIWHLGFLDAIPGIIICTSLSFYSFLVRSKLWRLYHAS